MAIETETPIRMRMQAAVLSGSRRGEIADIVVGEPNGLFINDCENPSDLRPKRWMLSLSASRSGVKRRRSLWLLTAALWMQLIRNLRPKNAKRGTS